MSEHTPLLRNQSGSSSSFGQNPVYSGNSRKEPDEESKPSLKQRIAFQCDTGKRGRLWELFDAMLSIMFFSLYIWNTQYVLPDHNPIPFPHSLQTADFVLACLILIQFLPRVWLDKEPLHYIGSYFAILTWISVFPVIFAYIQTIHDTDMDNTYMGVERYVFIYPLRFVRAHVSVQMLLVPARSSLFYFSTITRKGLKIGVTIMFTFLTVAAWIHIISFKQITSHLDLSFYDAFWYTVVSSTNGMSTNLIPENSWTRLVILYIMIAGAIFIPTHLSELLNLIQQKSKYDRAFKGEKSHRHIVVTGDFDSTSLFEFLREFFCQDHGLKTMNTDVVILNPDEPSDDIALLLEDPAFVHRVQYVKGSSAFRRSLVKVKAESACAAFLLSPKFSRNNDRDDAAQLMRALALKKYNNRLQLYVQIHLPENASYFDLLAEDVICIDELTLGLMAQSLVTPGFASLVVLLTTSVTHKVANELIQSAKKQQKKQELEWAIDYIRGLQQEIYEVKFSNAFIGKTFLECSELIYTHMDAVLFSIGIRTGHSSSFQIFLNPQDYVIKGGENEIGFVISDNAEIAVKMKKVGLTTENGRKYDGKPTMNQVPIEPLGTTDDMNIIPGHLSSDTMVRRANYKKEKEYWDGSIDSDVKSVENHVLICNCSNTFPENLDIFVAVLRERNSVCCDMPVVILSNCMPSEYERYLLKKFKDVYFVKGTPLRRKDLYRAKVDYAKRCVVLCDATRCEESHDTADAASLMVALDIESLVKDCFVLVECMYRETFKMIRESDTVKNKQEDYIQALMRPSFMNGSVFTSSSLDTILGQCFYNKHITLILKRLIFTHDAGDNNLSLKIDMQRGPDWNSPGITSGHMFLVDVQKSHVGREYMDIYAQLVRSHKAVPLGLYRHVIHKSKGMRYIYINPRRDCIIEKDDKIYLISTKAPNFGSDVNVEK